jgi:hypothetical protein
MRYATRVWRTVMVTRRGPDKRLPGSNSRFCIGAANRSVDVSSVAAALYHLVTR